LKEIQTHAQLELIPDPLVTVKAIAHWPTQWIWDQLQASSLKL